MFCLFLHPMIARNECMSPEVFPPQTRFFQDYWNEIIYGVIPPGQASPRSVSHFGSERARTIIQLALNATSPSNRSIAPPTDPEDDGPEDCAKRARNIIRMAFLTDEQQQLETAREVELTMQSFDGFWHMVGEDDETAEKWPSRQTCRKLPQRAATSSYCREPPPAPAAVTTSRHCQSPQATTASSRRCVRRPCRDSSPQEAVASRRRQEKTLAQARRLKPPPQHTVDATHNQQQPLTWVAAGRWRHMSRSRKPQPPAATSHRLKLLRACSADYRLTPPLWGEKLLYLVKLLPGQCRTIGQVIVE